VAKGLLEPQKGWPQGNTNSSCPGVASEESGFADLKRNKKEGIIKQPSQSHWPTGHWQALITMVPIPGESQLLH
jgi:hypothetical protein